MKSNTILSFKKSGLLLFSFLFFQNIFSQAVYTPLILSGFNGDVVCNAANCTGTASLDDLGWHFYSSDKNPNGAIPQTLTSQMGITYKLASFDENNVLTIGHTGESANTLAASGTLTLGTPVQTREIWVLGLSASGEKNIDATVKYTDNTTETSRISFPDWYQGNRSAALGYGFGRVKDNTNYDGRNEFGLGECIISVNSGKSIQSIQFSYTNSDRTYTSIFAISAYVSGERAQSKELYMIANAHFDTQWDWDVQTSIDEYVKHTWEGNFNLFEKYSKYKFNFEGAIKYMFAKEYYPELYEKTKKYIASGNWHISGGSIDANDVMIPSAESVIRNFLLGQEFYKKEFGIKGGNDIMLPDCFGFPYSLPTLGKHCGVVGFHSQKLSWGSAYDYNSLPHFGVWRGVDGSEIYAVHKGGDYSTLYHEDLSYSVNIMNEVVLNENATGSAKTFRYFGTGDRGGSVPESVAGWMQKSIESNGPLKVYLATPDEFFESFTTEERAALPVWDNELPMKTHGTGCYTSQAILKYWNRKNELLADAVEKSSVLADWTGGLPYQSDIIRDTWIRVLWHQFHDDLTGTSIPRAYTFTYNDHVLAQLDFSRTLNNAVGAVTRNMDTQTTGTPIVVYNPLSIERTDIVEARIAMAREPAGIRLYDKDDNLCPSQILKYENGILLFIFEAKVPSLGYATYDLQMSDERASANSSLVITNQTIENESYKLTINQDGNVSSIIDKKQNNKELLKSPILLTYQSNNSPTWPSWEIIHSDIVRNPIGFVSGNPRISIAEEGPLRSTLKIVRTQGTSEFVQYIRMTAGTNADRIDFVNEVDWQDRKTLLKAVFPLNTNNEKATYDISIGTIERGNNKDWLYEVAGHQWADLTDNDNSYGISILNDCKYGWDKPDNNTLRLTLIHTPDVGHERQYLQHQDLGLNVFTYSFFRHLGKWNESTQWQAAKLNQPLLAYETPKHEGALGKSVEFVRTNTDKVAIKALKKAEASDDIIVRVYEITGNNYDNVEISFPANIVSATEVNGLEEEMGSVAMSENKISFPITKYQPKTFKVKLADYTATLNEPSSTQASLIYNIDVMSADSKKRDGRFGTSDFVYPAELMPNEIVADGIKFKVGPREEGEKNAVQCGGQKIDLPQSASNKKLYILAASQNIEGSEVEFLVDGVAHYINVEYFAGFVGQWGTVYVPQNYRKENVAFIATHRHNYSQNKNESYSFLYIYKYVISIDGNAKRLTLPDDSDVIVFAVSVSDNENDDVKPTSDIYLLPEYKDVENVGEEKACASRLTPSKVSASGSVSTNEGPEMASDNDVFSKWCDNKSVNKWIEYDFGKEVEICQWNVVHAGIESDNWITSDFRLQYYNENNELINADVVTGNTSNRTSRKITPIRTKKVRLTLDKEEQGKRGDARIYSFDVFGNYYGTTGLNQPGNPAETSFCYPNPLNTKTIFSWVVPAETDNIVLSVCNLSGTLIDKTTFPVSAGGKQKFTWYNESQPAGIYFYSLTANSPNGIVSKSNGKLLIR